MSRREKYGWIEGRKYFDKYDSFNVKMKSNVSETEDDDESDGFPSSPKGCSCKPKGVTNCDSFDVKILDISSCDESKGSSCNTDTKNRSSPSCYKREKCEKKCSPKVCSTFKCLKVCYIGLFCDSCIPDGVPGDYQPGQLILTCNGLIYIVEDGKFCIKTIQYPAFFYDGCKIYSIPKRCSKPGLVTGCDGDVVLFSCNECNLSFFKYVNGCWTLECETIICRSITARDFWRPVVTTDPPGITPEPYTFVPVTAFEPRTIGWNMLVANEPLVAQVPVAECTGVNRFEIDLYALTINQGLQNSSGTVTFTLLPIVTQDGSNITGETLTPVRSSEVVQQPPPGTYNTYCFKFIINNVNVGPCPLFIAQYIRVPGTSYEGSIYVTNMKICQKRIFSPTINPIIENISDTVKKIDIDKNDKI